MSDVVVVESPAKAKTINRYLGGGYTVLASFGHVRDLPPKQRQAVSLRYVADLSHREIAAVMETSEDAARRNVHEALVRLRGQVAS